MIPFFMLEGLKPSQHQHGFFQPLTCQEMVALPSLPRAETKTGVQQAETVGEREVVEDTIYSRVDAPLFLSRSNFDTSLLVGEVGFTVLRLFLVDLDPPRGRH